MGSAISLVQNHNYQRAIAWQDSIGSPSLAYSDHEQTPCHPPQDVERPFIVEEWPNEAVCIWVPFLFLAICGSSATANYTEETWDEGAGCHGKQH